VGANAYLTPPHARGFPAHFDAHDVFVLQLEGTKHWSVYPPAMAAPLPDQWFPVHGKPLGLPLYEVALQAGDLLYIPRGYVHEARTSTCASLHLTVGVDALTWLDLLASALTGVGMRLASFRQSLPVRLFDHQEGPVAVGDQFRELLRSFAEHAGFEDAVERLAERFIDRLRPFPTGRPFSLPPLEEINLGTLLRKRPGMVCHVREAADAVVIQYPGNRFRGPAKITPTLRFVAAARTFPVHALPGLSEDGQLLLARRLVREGLLEVAPTPAPP
jgi:hypothetical protein